MKNTLRSAKSLEGRRMAGARSLWLANGMKREQFGKPIIGIANSFTQLVPGHVHLHEVGQMMKRLIEEQGCFAAEFNSIAIDDGIAMGHEGMLYSLPSRELIADSLEYMVNAHCLDALVCISNCDKITPGMLMAAMRLNIPTIFVSGGPMEAGRVKDKSYDLIDAMVMAADSSVSDEDVAAVEEAACPTCGCCSGMFTANSMNCLNEALGMALPGNGTVVATHAARQKLFDRAAQRIVEMAFSYYRDGDDSVLPRKIGSRNAFLNAMSLDIAMGGSTNTVLHLLAIAQEAEVDFSIEDIDNLSRNVPNICKVAPSSFYHVEDVNRAGGIHSIMGELDLAGLLNTAVSRVDGLTLKEALDRYHLGRESISEEALELYRSAPGRKGRNLSFASQGERYGELDFDRKDGCIRSVEHAYYPEGGLAVLFGNIAERGSIVKTAGVDSSILTFSGRARVYDSQDQACEGILSGEVEEGEVVIIRYEGPKGGPGMQEMLYPTTYLKSRHIDKNCALITDGRFSGGTSGLSIGHVSPEAAAEGAIALVKTGDIIEIDIPARKINLRVTADELEARFRAERGKGKNGFKPAGRSRTVSKALKMYAAFATSADLGAVRKLF